MLKKNISKVKRIFLAVLFEIYAVARDVLSKLWYARDSRRIRVYSTMFSSRDISFRGICQWC